MPDMTMAELIEDYESLEDIRRWHPFNELLELIESTRREIWETLDDLGIDAVRYKGRVYRGSGRGLTSDERAIPDARSITIPGMKRLF